MSASTWVELDSEGLYGPSNLPYGVFVVGEADPKVGVRIGDFVLDVSAVESTGKPAAADTLRSSTMNEFFEAGPDAWHSVREWIIELLTNTAFESATRPHLHPLADVTMLMPFTVGDYVDYYASEHHATNLGRLFRPDSEPLMPNWKHMPIGYHGRSGTIIPSETPVVRPCGQLKPKDADKPHYGPSQRLDIEAEMGFVVGVPTDLGDRVSVSEFSDYVFGVTLVNDWSARDIQAWEYQPLGPYLGKSFATSISPWITPLAALESARIQPPARDLELLDYLKDDQDDPWGLDVDLEVTLNDTVVSHPPLGQMYFTGAQMLAHMTVNGAVVRSGDFYASGTISGPEPEHRGSFIELAWGGKEPVTLNDGSQRTFLEDGDTVTITATAPGANGTRIGLGAVAGTVEPARD